VKVLLLLVGLWSAIAISMIAHSADDDPNVTHTLIEDISWTELPDGRATASIHGDMSSGEHITYVRFPPGMRTAVHTHSRLYDGIIISGTARHFKSDSEGSALWLAPGSVYQVPAGVPHISECSEDTICIFAIHQHGAFDRSVVD
jgi:quercetin dioxygenase-like cupin family protein